VITHKSPGVWERVMLGVAKRGDGHEDRTGAGEQDVGVPAAGADLRAVAASLGHVSTTTTQAYAEDAETVKDNPARYLSGLL
jgi:hypothetical protein